ncbi:ATP-dependent DNA ligase [Cytobacillus praedii]|uniref:ATP-dependent DNA ligase n=1 Tax=Cytobacillus praedii TaxID=1742358 RepID=UPI003F7DCB9D
MLNTPIKPMLLQPATIIPTTDNYIHQIKFDGIRTILHYDRGSIKIYTRHKNVITLQFPEMKNLRLPVQNCILDGELICFDTSDGTPKPSFDDIMIRFQATNQIKIEELVKQIPAHFAAFDVLYLNGSVEVSKPLGERLSLLEEIVTNNEYISICQSYSDGNVLFDKIVDLGLEGIVSKHKDKRYHLDSRPIDVFYKIKNYQYDIVAISAIRKQKFGWVMSKDNRYMGMLEFVSPVEREAFYKIYKQLIIKEDKEYIHLDPVIKCKVKYQCLSKKGYMRSASLEKFII